MQLRFIAGGALGLTFATVASPLGFFPVIATGVLTGVATCAGSLIGQIAGEACDYAIDKFDIKTSYRGALGNDTALIGLMGGAVVGCAVGYSASVDYFSDENESANDSAYIQQVDEAQNVSPIAQYKSENGSYVLPAQTVKLAA